ncbi:MAG: DMT family transporter [Candidatus Puniceispirillaceae bacterium]
MMLATFCFPTMDVMAKYLLQSQPVMQVVWARYTGQFLLILFLFAPRLKKIIITRYPRLQLARSAALFGGTCFFFLSLNYLDQGQTAAIFMVAPLLITAMAVLFLGEKIGLRRVLSVIAGFAGALVIIQPQSDIFTPASLLPLGAASFYASYSILTRKLGDAESPNTTLFFTAGFGAVCTSLLLPFIWVAPDSPGAVIMMASMSLFGGLGHYAVILSLQRVEASETAPLNYLGVVFAMFWGFMVFAEIPAPATLSGAAIIILSGIYVWRREKIRKK